MTTTDEQHSKTILQQRAQKLAEAAPQYITDNSVPLTRFMLDQQHYAIETQYVHATLLGGQLTAVPNPSPFLAGLTFAFGIIVPVINTAVLLQLPTESQSVAYYLLIGAGQPELALAVTSVSGQFDFPLATIKPVPNQQAELIAGLLTDDSAAQHCTLLSGAKLLADNRLYFSL